MILLGFLLRDLRFACFRGYFHTLKVEATWSFPSSQCYLVDECAKGKGPKEGIIALRASQC